ncbi:MAG TPA: hypothetical protein VI457_12250 [Methylococcaceae bacterium]|nr:hypothetical protein [Methylococcaceae bacterium]
MNINWRTWHAWLSVILSLGRLVMDVHTGEAFLGKRWNWGCKTAGISATICLP